MFDVPLMEWWSADTLVSGGIFLAAALVSLAVLRRERAPIRQAVAIFLLSAVLRGVAVLASAGGLGGIEGVAGFLTLLFQGVAFISLSIIILFSILSGVFRIDMPRLLHDLTKAMAFIGLVLYLFSINDVDVSGIVATSAVITAVIGFSLQDVLSNIMGGIALHLDRSVQAGDWLTYEKVDGIVREIGWRHTSIETRDGDRFIVPNNQIMKNVVMLQGKRWDGSTKERRWVTFNVDYRHSPLDVINVVTEALTRQSIEGVAVEPSPHVIFYDYKDSWGHYSVRYWLTRIAEPDVIDSTIRARVFHALKRAQISVAIPTSTMFMQRDRGERVRLAARRKASSLEALGHVSILSGLTDLERDRLSEDLVYTPFVNGEAVILQGQRGEDLFILTRGSVEVRVSVGASASSTVATIDAPDYFGEFGMLTGEERQASVIALTEVECWRLGKETFQEVLTERPQIAAEVSHTLAEREVELKTARESISDHAKKKLIATEHQSILDRIEHFFGI